MIANEELKNNYSHAENNIWPWQMVEIHSYKIYV